MLALWGERDYGDGSIPYARVSSIALLPWLPSFPPQAFPTQSPPSHPFSPSCHSPQQPCPGIAPQSPSSRSQLLRLLGDVWLQQVLILIHLGCHRSAVSFSALNVSPLTRQLPRCGDRTPASVPPPAEGRSCAINTPAFPPSPFILLSFAFAWFYISCSTGQVLVSTPSWCSACTSVSEGVFLMYPWREMYSMST